MYRDLPLIDFSDEGTTTEVDALALDVALLDVAAESFTAWIRPFGRTLVSQPREEDTGDGHQAGPDEDADPLRPRPEWAARLDER